MDITVEHGDSFAAALAKIDLAAVDFVSIHGNCAGGPDTLTQLSGHGAMYGALHGATSCLGAMSQQGQTTGAAVFAITDPDGAYGTATSAFSDGPRQAAAAATQKALARADRLGEQPALVWLAATPGAEEDVLKGVEDIIGADIPIIGGSAADNSVSGDWFVFDATGSLTEGVIVSVLFPSTPVSLAYQSGYSPKPATAKVTKAQGRKILELDGRPAMELYADWTGGDVSAVADPTGTEAILSDSTMWPLGRENSQVGDVPFYLLAHPAVAHGDGSMDLFATVAEGETLTLMNGTQESLIERAGRVAKLACETGRMPQSNVAGALMIYCGGCMLSVQDRIGDVVDGVNDALGHAPFLGAFTFGEQGNLLNVGNRHGNLMISCIAFAKE
ncbi:MAG: FIST N-terminal domain-containing protein [Pseudomonadota bacterium]